MATHQPSTSVSSSRPTHVTASALPTLPRKRKKKDIKLDLDAIIDKDVASQSPRSIDPQPCKPSVKPEPKDNFIDLTLDDDSPPRSSIVPEVTAQVPPVFTPQEQVATASNLAQTPPREVDVKMIDDQSTVASVTDCDILMAKIACPSSSPVPETPATVLPSETVGIESTESDGFSEEMCVLATSRGVQNTRGTVTFTVHLDSEQFAALQIWKSKARNIQDSICVSLACYLCDELAENINSFPKLKPFQVFNKSLSPASWPPGLLIRASLSGESIELMLSDLVQPSGLVDLVPFLNDGSNTITLLHQKDLMKYCFVLHSHRPWRFQLQSIIAYNSQWDQTVADLLRPLQPAPSPFASA